MLDVCSPVDLSELLVRYVTKHATIVTVVIVIFSLLTLYSSPCSNRTEDGRCVCRNMLVKLKGVVYFLNTRD